MARTTPDPDRDKDLEPRPARLLVILPSWVGDTVMATPTLRVLRELLPGAFIGALARPGIDDLLEGSTLVDELHTGRAQGMMGPKRIASRIRPRRYDTALLLTNSFSTALIARLAGIPRRIGYERDGRGLMLTDRLTPPRRRDTPPYNRSTANPGAWAPVPACDYYYALGAHLLRRCGLVPAPMGPMDLLVTRAQELAAEDILDRAGVPFDGPDAPPLALLNPGGNDDTKRWPPDRFAGLADALAERHGMTILLNGSPAEAALIHDVAARCNPATRTVELPRLGITLGALKGIAQRARIMITNDTGPRHVAAALGVPVVTLFGPTDPRWTTIPFTDEILLTADPTLPDHEIADDHPQRCRIDRIGVGDVVAAAHRLLTTVPSYRG